MKSINVKEQTVSIIRVNNEDYISITHIARFKNPKEPKDVVKNWLRNRSTIEYLGLWEKINNPEFKGVEFDPLLFEAGSNSFTLSPSKWIETTNAIGIYNKLGRGGGTYAQKERLIKLNEIAISQMKSLLVNKSLKKLKDDNK